MDMKKLKIAYNMQRRRCKMRKDKNSDPIEMRLSFNEWLEIWILSGHLHERGKGKNKYVMARINDIGHYEIGNVQIKLHADNISEAHKGKIRSLEHSTAISIAKKGKKTLGAGAKKGKKQSPEHKAANSAAQRAAWERRKVKKSLSSVSEE